MWHEVNLGDIYKTTYDEKDTQHNYTDQWIDEDLNVMHEIQKNDRKCIAVFDAMFSIKMWRFVKVENTGQMWVNKLNNLQKWIFRIIESWKPKQRR